MNDQGCTSLESQLARHFAAVQRRPSQNNAKWSRQLPMYATAVGSALALTTNAHADIIYSGPQSVTASVSQHQNGTGNSHGSASFKMDGQVFDLEVSYSPGRGRRGGTSGGAAIYGNGALILGSRGVALRLSSGANISSSAGRFLGAGVLAQTGGLGKRRGPTPGFNSGQTGFIGVKIGLNYGWVELKESNGTNYYPKSITELGWAYETVAGQSILAGQTVEAGTPAATPEPASISLMLLAMGSGGVLAWRKRRTEMASAA